VPVNWEGQGFSHAGTTLRPRKGAKPLPRYTFAKVRALLGGQWRRNPTLMQSVVALFRAIAIGTVLAFFLSLSRPMIEPTRDLLGPYLTLPRPIHWKTQALIVLLLLLLIALFKKLPWRIWRSLKLGLIPLQSWLWALSVAIFWLALESHRARLAWSSLAFAGLLTGASLLIGPRSTKSSPSDPGFLESDFPVPEGGEDLLGRQGIVAALVSTIVLEQPEIIAVTGMYGEGKTSFLNLTVGELKKLEEDDLPIIVRFSPWLAGDSNGLVLSLLNSIVAEIKGRFVVPGLGRDAARYARVLLSAIPKAERLKDFIAETSQEERIDALADRISRTRGRVLVILDDLDRMEAKELETVFKLLRGSDRLSNITFLCAFSPADLAEILKATRPAQDTSTFIEKFFPVEFPLPKVDPRELLGLLSRKLTGIISRYGLPSDENFSKSLDDIWEGGAGPYFRNLRRIKLFLNKIDHSLKRIASEVNIEDFIRLELIRDVAPNVYELIYSSPEYFYTGEFAFETRFKGFQLDEGKAKKERADFYDKMVASVSADKQYVFHLLEDLFPNFLVYRQKFTTRTVSAAEAEEAKRIFHPRCFRQYFLFKTPSELLSQKEFQAFLSSARNLGEGEAADAFSKVFQSLEHQDFKQWHFMHLIESRFNEFKLSSRRGLCRGMARNSAPWPTDAFVLLIAIRTTRETLAKIADSSDRQELLRAIARESTSDLYTLVLVRRLEEALKADPSAIAEGERFKALGFRSETDANLMSDLQEVKGYIKALLRERYLIPDAPSVFEQFGKLGSEANRVEPNLFLFNWQFLGTDAQSDARTYLRSLFKKRPQDLNEFLMTMFRVDFIDDYTILKALIDYKELSKLITLNEGILDKDKVRQFRQRYDAEKALPATVEGTPA
jgi:hypothetical protein